MRVDVTLPVRQRNRYQAKYVELHIYVSLIYVPGQPLLCDIRVKGSPKCYSATVTIQVFSNTNTNIH